MQNSTPSATLKHFAKHLFLASRIYTEKARSQKDVQTHLDRMRKSIIRMSLSYTDVDRLKEKISRLIDYERKFAKIFKPEDTETAELKRQIAEFEQGLFNEKEEKSRIASENQDKIRQMSQSLDNIKAQMNHLLIEKAKRHQRYTALEQKIRGKVDTHKYYRS